MNSNPAASNTESKDMKLCQEICEKCAQVADLCAAEEARLKAPERTPLAVLCLDVAESCRATAAALVRHSPQHPLFCALSAQVARLCADECDKPDSQHELSKSCREACIACADECARHAVEAPAKAVI